MATGIEARNFAYHAYRRWYICPEGETTFFDDRSRNVIFQYYYSVSTHKLLVTSGAIPVKTGISTPPSFFEGQSK